MKPISRADAKSQSLKHYFTGKPCSRGHVEIRMTSTGTCLACSREISKAYREKHPDMVRKTKSTHRARNKEAEAAYNREYKTKNKDVLKERARLYREQNLEKDRARQRQRYHENREARLEYMRKYRKERQHVRTALQAKRKARLRQALPPWFGEFDAFVWEEAHELKNMRRDATGINWHADHMIPLAARKACGLHVAENCQVIPARLNNWKHNKMILTEPREWLQYL